jgi:hypothetical protein
LLSINMLTTMTVVAADSALPRNATIADIHTAIITPSSDALFSAESSPPMTPADWAHIRHSAEALAKSAKLLMSKDRPKDNKQWMLFARALRDESNRAAQAAKNGNAEAFISANGRIVAVCEACHDDYRDGGHGMTSDKEVKK